MTIESSVFFSKNGDRKISNPIKVTCREGEQFKFGVKPAGGSLSFDVEKISDDITEPTGLIGQFLSEVSYEIDDEHNIITK